MQDKTLYNEILGLSKPWSVMEVDLNVEEGEVYLHIGYSAKVFKCPECSKEYGIYDHRKERKWRHLDTCQMKTFLISSIPRIKCKEHGVRTVKVPWAESSDRVTILFERFAINLLLATKNQTKAAEILRVDFKVLHHIMEKAVKRGLNDREDHEIKYIGIDEKSMRRGHTYLTVLSDTEKKCIIDVGESRTKNTAKSLLNNSLTSKQKKSVEAVSMDMWKAYLKATKEVLPNSEIVHDRFHIMKYLNEAVDKTRSREARKLFKQGDECLKKTKYLFLKNHENLSEKQLTRFQEIQTLNLEVSKAWAAKENFKEFFNSPTINDAKFFFAEWYQALCDQTLDRMITVGKMLIRHSEGLLNYINHQISNAVAEWLNSKIQELKTIGRGFRSFDNYRLVILFFLGKLNLYPQHSP